MVEISDKQFEAIVAEAIDSIPERYTKRTKNTMWHEVAHYYGLDHIKIHELEDSSGK